jgi:hypothetical protein
VSAFKQILDFPFDNNRLSCVNAAVLLPDLAKLKRPEIADFLVTLLEDPKKHDSIKLWAAQALAEFFPATEFDVVLKKGDQAAELQKQTDLKRVNALLKFVTRKWTPAKDASKGEIEGFRYARRMAIYALADARVPVIEADPNPKAKKLAGAVIQALLPILDKDAYTAAYGDTPEPSLAEKIEAVIAIGRMKVQPNSAYQPDEGIYRVGTALVEVATAYKIDFNRFAGKGAQLKNIPSILPWKRDGRRLQMALADMADSVRNDAARVSAWDNARKLQSAALPLLNAMQAGQANFNAQDLADVVKTLRPSQSTQLFKGISTAQASNGG